MGTYLSTPVTEKGKDSGRDTECEHLPLSWAVVDMQGWRKSMEDAHVAVTGIPYSSKGEGMNAKVFGVFDGHGGAEVARFCQLYLVPVLEKQSTWNVASHADGDAVSSPEGQALIEAFHALDRMIDDDSRRSEIGQLRANKPHQHERREVASIPEPGTSKRLGIASGSQSQNASASQKVPTNGRHHKTGCGVPTPATRSDNPSVEQSVSEPGQPETTGGNTRAASIDRDKALADSDDEDEDNSESDSDSDGGSEAVTAKTNVNSDNAQNICKNEDGDDAANTDEDSTEAVGKEEAAEIDRGMLDETDESTDTKQSTQQSITIISNIIQKILSMGGQSGQVAVKFVGDKGQGTTVDLVASTASANDSNGNSSSSSSTVTSTNGLSPLSVQPPVHPRPSASQPTLVKNGRMTCNLPDHPIHAGCTAIVALMTGKTLTVANAGDSRGVLCRKGGVAFPLSFDHKPQHQSERKRIEQAGGFVNHFGRVNGNLNLSRSIGDLKYKQVPGIDPADQMITAQPDIVQLELRDDDEFIILGCDGIWDCLSNDGAVQFVRERIGFMSLEQIGAEMLDQIISEDPRLTQGIGGDNMTVMVIDLQPATRLMNREHDTEQEAATAAFAGEEEEEEGS